MEYSREELEKITELFKILSDATRVQIIHSLSDEKCVSELAQELGMAQPAVSHQLSVLKANKLVTRKRKGKQIYYQLSNDFIKRVLKMGEKYVHPIKINSSNHA